MKTIERKESSVVTDRGSADHYRWGVDCQGWRLLDSEELAVIEEEMSRQTSERLHYHLHSRQVFYVLSGVARLQIDGGEYTAATGQAVTIAPGQRHRIINDGVSPIRFIVISQPSTRNDRYDL